MILGTALLLAHTKEELDRDTQESDCILVQADVSVLSGLVR